MEQHPIQIDRLWFSYNQSPVLEEVSLTVERGDFACLVGPNGGGKSTLLKCILGLLQPRKGTVSVFGRPPAQVSHRLGYLQQNPGFDPKFPLTVMDLVLMGRLKRGLFPVFYSRRDRELAAQALSETGMYEQRKRSFAELSGGQRQRSLIARVLTTEPEVLLLDEPTSHLDLQAEKELYELLSRLNQRLTMVMVSHDLFIVSRFVNKVVCVKGRVVVHPTAEISEELVGELYGGEMKMVRHTHHGPPEDD